MSTDTSESPVKSIQVEKMIRGIDKRIAALEVELDRLRKQRSACEVLLSPDSAEIQPKSAAKSNPTNPAKRRNRSGVHLKIAELLQSVPEGLAMKEISDRLVASKAIEGSRPDLTVYVGMKRHPELFKKEEGTGLWTLIKSE